MLKQSKYLKEHMSMSATCSDAYVGVSSSITFLNFTGDITITWDEENRERILQIVRKKMAEGYSFFTAKTVPIVRVKRRARITEANMDTVSNITITDTEFDKLVKSMDDNDVAELVSSEKAVLARRVQPGSGRSRDMTVAQRLTTAEDVLDKNSVAIRPIVGG